MPLFAQAGTVDAARLAEAWGALFPEHPALHVRGSMSSVAEVNIGRGTVMVAHVPTPVPRDEVARVVRASWMLAPPHEAVLGHRAHAVVSAPPGGDPVERAWSATRVSAALLQAGDGVALYYGSARQVHSSRLVLEMSSRAERPPVPLWVGLTVSGPRDGPLSAATHGLEALGHTELEVLDACVPIGTLRVALYDLALLLLRGAEVRDGDTVGPTEDLRWRVRRATSRLVPGRPAMVIELR